MCFTKVIQLVRLERSDKRTLVPFEKQLCHELSQALNVEQLDDVDLVIQSFRRLLVPLQAFLAALVAVGATAAAAAESLNEASQQVLRVVVEVLAALCHRLHHFMLSFLLRFARLVVVRRGRVNSSNKGVLKFECLITAKHEEESAPKDAAQTTDKT